MTCEQVDGARVGCTIVSRDEAGWMRRSIVHVIVEHTSPTGHWTNDQGETMPVKLLPQDVSDELGDSSHILMVQEEFSRHYEPVTLEASGRK